MTTSNGARPEFLTDDARYGPWVREHLERYLQTNGEEGHIWRGLPTLLLTTIGRKSGNPVTTPLIYGEDAGRHIVVASRSGAPTHPSGASTSKRIRPSACRSPPISSKRRRERPLPTRSLRSGG